MFWRYNLITGSCIESLLDTEGVTLKELLDEGDILQECKAQTKKLLDFLVRPEIVEELVTLTITEPEENADEKLRYRYSNVACELLTFDIAQINDALVGNEVLLQKLYNFLLKEESLNPLLASFFSKTMGLLFTKRTEMMYEFFKDKDFLSLILKHLNTSAIMDLLLRFLTIENSQMFTAILKWLSDQKLIQKLVSRIDVEYGEDFNCNASHALCDIIKVSREQMSLLQDKAEQNPLLEALESVEVVSELLDHMFKDTTKDSPIVNGIQVLLSLLVFKKQGPGGVQQIPSNTSEQPLQTDNAPSCFLTMFRNSETEQITSLDAERLATGVYNVVNAIQTRLEDFHNLLIKPPPKPAITLTIGCLDPPLGNCRLEVANLLTALLYTNNHDVNVKMAELGTILVLMDMFFKFPWNNFLHTQVEQSIGRIITNPPTVDKEGNKVHPLLDQILGKYKITVKIVEQFEGDPNKSVLGACRKGYMGHLTKIANHIVQNSENGVNSCLIKERLKELPEEHQKKWDEFGSEKLAEINNNNKVCVISGPSNTSASADEDSVDFRDIPFGKDTSVHLAFSDYQMREMTNNFVDTFGFNDEEFGDADESLIYARSSINPLSQSFPVGDASNLRSAELFEEVCRGKISTEWSDNDQRRTNFSSCFRMRDSSKEESSSDSDEESQVFESENTPIVLASEEIKMDVDSQEAIFSSVPMEVEVPGAAANPWGVETSNTSEEPQNWADFSNFASFETNNPDQSDAITSPATVAQMETSVLSSENKAVLSKDSETNLSESSKAESTKLSSDVEQKPHVNTSSSDAQPTNKENLSSRDSPEK